MVYSLIMIPLWAIDKNPVWGNEEIGIQKGGHGLRAEFESLNSGVRIHIYRNIIIYINHQNRSGRGEVIEWLHSCVRVYMFMYFLLEVSFGVSLCLGAVRVNRGGIKWEHIMKKIGAWELTNFL